MQPSKQTSLERVSLRLAHPGDASLLKRWRSEPSVRRYQPLGPVSVSQLSAELASQRLADLYRGRGEKFQWIIRCLEQPVGWLTQTPLQVSHCPTMRIRSPTLTSIGEREPSSLTIQ